jgi:hypothetical protein
MSFKRFIIFSVHVEVAVKPPAVAEKEKAKRDEKILF